MSSAPATARRSARGAPDTPRTARRRRLAAASALLALPLGSCVHVPAMPGPMPDDLRPDIETPQMADPGSLTPDGVDAAERMAIRIRNVGCGQLSTGSGFAVDERTVVTNRHVVAGTDQIQITTYDGQEFAAEYVGITELADLALLQTSAPVVSVPGLAEQDPEPGESITVVGYPQGGRLTTSTGTVIGYEPDPLGADVGLVGRTDALVDHGSSGSAVLNDDGEVVGVIYAMDSWNNGYMVPVSTLQELLETDDFAPLGSCRES